MTLDVERIRSEFPALSRWTHFALAHKAPLPRAAEQAFAEIVSDFADTGGRRSYDMERVEEARATLARLVGVPGDCLAFVKNTSEGIGIAAAGLAWSEGDEVLVSELEHEANLLPWRRLQSRGVTVTMAPGGTDELVARVGPQTRVVAASWVTYGTGYRFDLPRLGRACREHGALLVADAIQGVGVLATPLSELGADIVACGGHKGLLGLAGAGFLYCRREVLTTITPPHASKFSFADPDKRAPRLRLADDAHRFEYGNPNFVGIAVLKRSAELIESIGLPAIEERVRSLTTRLMERLRAHGRDVLTPEPWAERAGIVSVAVPHPEETRRRLADQRILVSVKDGRYLRMACHVYNTDAEVDRLAAAIGACA